MIKRTGLLLVVVMAAATAAGTFAEAKPSHVKKSHAVHLQGTIATIAVKGQPPAPGSRRTSAGQVKGSPGGSGAIIVNTTFDAKGAFHGTATVFLSEGSYSGPFTGHGTLNPDGTLTIKINGKTTSGTGLYEGAHGKATLIGKASLTSPVSTFTATGSITY